MGDSLNKQGEWYLRDVVLGILWPPSACTPAYTGAPLSTHKGEGLLEVYLLMGAGHDSDYKDMTCQDSWI